MNKIKHTFPDEAALEAVIDKESDAIFARVYEVVRSEEAAFKDDKRKQRLSLVVSIAAVLSLFVLLYVLLGDERFARFFGAAGVHVLVFGFIGSYILCRFVFFRSHFNAIAFNNKVNRVILAELMALFGAEGELIEQEMGVRRERRTVSVFGRLIPVTIQTLLSPQAQSVLDLLTHSELITEAHNTNKVDTMFVSHIKGTKIFCAELDCAHVTGSGKNRQTRQIFKGWFVSCDLARTLTGKTFLSGEGDTKGFAHQSFWQGITGGAEVKETQLEWNDFEKLLHVATSDAIEARTILTPDFMQTVYEWWKGKSGTIRLSFIANRMYILFPDSGAQFHSTIGAIDQKSVSEYMKVMGRPLLHIAHLVEEVN